MTKKVDFSKVSSQQELRTKLRDVPIEERYKLIDTYIAKLEQEIEVAISQNQNNLAIWKMSQEVIFEDELMLLERLINKKGVMV
jgi:hypothetical protein